MTSKSFEELRNLRDSLLDDAPRKYGTMEDILSNFEAEFFPIRDVKLVDRELWLAENDTGEVGIANPGMLEPLDSWKKYDSINAKKGVKYVEIKGRIFLADLARRMDAVVKGKEYSMYWQKGEDGEDACAILFIKGSVGCGAIAHNLSKGGEPRLPESDFFISNSMLVSGW